MTTPGQASICTPIPIVLDGKTGNCFGITSLSHMTWTTTTPRTSTRFSVNSRTDRLVRERRRSALSMEKLTTCVQRAVYHATERRGAATTSPCACAPRQILGGDEWNSGAFSPKLNPLVMPANDQWCSTNMKDKEPPSLRRRTRRKSYSAARSITAFSGRAGLTDDAATGANAGDMHLHPARCRSCCYRFRSDIHGRNGRFLRRRPQPQSSAALRYGRLIQGRHHHSAQ